MRTWSKRGIWTMTVVTLLLGAGAAEASCRIRNETKHTFTIESGNTSNQRVGANTTTSIAAGRIVGKSDGGKTVGGSCRDGEEIRIVEEKGVPLIVAR